MARPEQPIIRTREGERGTAASVERLTQAVPIQQEPDDDAAFDEELASDFGSELELGDPLNGDLEDRLFSPTLRPDEPLTTGIPFGEGPSFVPEPFEDDETFMLRVATTLRDSPAGTGEARLFADRIERGE